MRTIGDQGGCSILATLYGYVLVTTLKKVHTVTCIVAYKVCILMEGRWNTITFFYTAFLLGFLETATSRTCPIKKACAAKALHSQR